MSPERLLDASGTPTDLTLGRYLAIREILAVFVEAV